MTFSVSDHPHRRHDPLSDRWILVSPHRERRPWLGAEDALLATSEVMHDPDCHLCPGNKRASGQTNPEYSGPFTFVNDFPAVLPASPSPETTSDHLFQQVGVQGEARVICYSQNHSRTLAQMAQAEVMAVVDCWCKNARELGQRYSNVQIFENKGVVMGASNPHPHGQVWATAHVPDLVETEDRTQRVWTHSHGAPMLLELARREIGSARSVVETEFWVAIVPYWAAWPFETLLLPRFAIKRLPDLDSRQREDLSRALLQLLARYDGLFGCSFPYSMGWHGAPFGQIDADHWQLHAHFYPPLLRSAHIRKFMVGYEMLGEAQRDLTPEQAADRLRAVDIEDLT